MEQGRSPPRPLKIYKMGLISCKWSFQIPKQYLYVYVLENFGKYKILFNKKSALKLTICFSGKDKRTTDFYSKLVQNTYHYHLSPTSGKNLKYHLKIIK